MVTVIDQQHAALIVANETRRVGAEIKRRLADPTGRGGSAFRLGAQILVDETDSIGHMRVFEFLLSIAGFGENRIRAVLRPVGIWPLSKIRDLSDRQVRVIAWRLEQLADERTGTAA